MKHGSLFSGIGGFDLAASWMGWENVFHCEWNQFGQQVLKYHFPNSVSYDDICKTDFTLWRGKVDIITGGFPCQPYSMAGKRKGTEDSRHLWPEMLRAIRECRPSWIVGENVPGLINWSGGLVFEQVCAELEGEGYEVQPIVLPASCVNAPHRRDRVWIVAYSEHNRNSNRPEEIQGESSSQRFGKQHSIYEAKQPDNVRPTQDPNEDGRGGDEWVDAYHNYTRLEGCEVIGETGRERQESYQFASGLLRTDWTDFPTQSPICGGNDGFSPDMDNATFFKQLGIDNPRQPAISYAKWRNESIKAYGNAIVPQVAFQIFKVIDEMNKQL